MNESSRYCSKLSSPNRSSHILGLPSLCEQGGAHLTSLALGPHSCKTKVGTGYLVALRLTPMLLGKVPDAKQENNE